MKKGKVLIAALAAVMIMTATIGSAMAYFSAYTTASGSQTVHLRPTTRIEERFDSWTKHITVTNTGEASCYIRAAVFAGGDIGCSCSGSGWTNGGDGYWYYGEIVPAGGTTQVLEVSIRNVPEEAKEGDSFNVAVVYECTPVFYEQDGTAYADWTAEVHVIEGTGGES